MHDWMKISSSRAETSTPEYVFIKSTKAFLTETIHIVRQFKTRLLYCLDKKLETMGLKQDLFPISAGLGFLGKRLLQPDSFPSF